jgi:hypothetical protein
MSSLNVDMLISQMVGAAKPELADKWPVIKDLAESSFKNLAQNIIDIEKMSLAGTISPEQARLLLNMQKNSAKIVMLSVETMGLVAVENALNAALNILKTTVNTALGFILI